MDIPLILQLIGYPFYLFIYYYFAGTPKQVARSFSGVLIVFKLKVSTRYCRTFGLINAGSVGPR